MQPNATEADAEAKPGASVGGLVARNTFYLTAAQVLTVPLAVGINAVMARYLGAEDFGYVYLAATLVGLGFLVVDWGSHGALPALIARNHDKASALVGSSLFWRGTMSIVAYVALAGGAHALGYGAGLQWAIALTVVCSLLNSFVAACKDGIRGFERTELPAIAHVAQQLLTAAFVIPVLMLGGGLRATLIASAIPIAIVLVPMLRALRSVGVERLSYDRTNLRGLLAEGTPFVFFGVAMVLQPNVDAIFLSKLAPPEVMGWYAATRRLIGVLLLPASALIGALYPTLCRLQSTDTQAFTNASAGALRGVALLVVPVALGCALYPEIGISIFSSSFEPAEDNLRILSLFLFLVYFSMPLGTCIMAAGKQRAWAIVQGLCVVVSLVLDPLLVPYFQERTGNGGMGLCVAAVISEVVVIVSGLVLVPKGVLDRHLGRALSFALLSGAAMAGVAWLTRSLWPILGASLAVSAYAVVLVVSGGIEKDQMAAIRASLGRRLSRFRPT